jgi:hypothetical protein
MPTTHPMHASDPRSGPQRSISDASVGSASTTGGEHFAQMFGCTGAVTSDLEPAEQRSEDESQAQVKRGERGHDRNLL